MTTPYKPEFFDPLSTERLTNVICGAFDHQPLMPMTDEIPKFEGSGLYAIYYRGTSIQFYAPLRDYEIPVYVGQSVSNNSATGKVVKASAPLHGRMVKHRVSVSDAGLPLDEFYFRALRTPDIHANLGEKGLISGYQPVWNSILRGFGSNEQGGATRQSAKSMWDTVHDGRKRTYGSEPHDREALVKKIEAHIQERIAAYEQLPWRRAAADVPGAE
ncbi:Eco29kI family restriction endonuclease [Streptomyces sp. NPDC058084]|uniref:Eco29kI family restriction endonuclease n=1 Tax=Streptomyces sp. NPDC058084 TaxID=3346333 RepID=UPI0036E17B2B